MDRDEWATRLTGRLAEGDWACAIRAVEQVVGRLKQLVRRPAVHEQIDAVLNVRLLWQMHANDALRPADLWGALSGMYDWVERLGDPADDTHLRAAERAMLAEVAANPSTGVPRAVLDLHGHIDQALLRVEAAIEILRPAVRFYRDPDAQ